MPSETSHVYPSPKEPQECFWGSLACLQTARGSREPLAQTLAQAPCLNLASPPPLLALSDNALLGRKRTLPSLWGPLGRPRELSSSLQLWLLKSWRPLSQAL